MMELIIFSLAFPSASLNPCLAHPAGRVLLTFSVMSRLSSVRQTQDMSLVSLMEAIMALLLWVTGHNSETQSRCPHRLYIVNKRQLSGILRINSGLDIHVPWKLQ